MFFQVKKLKIVYSKCRWMWSKRILIALAAGICILTIAYKSKLKHQKERIPELPIMDEKGTGCKVPHLNPVSKDMMESTKTVSKPICLGENWVECQCHILPEVLLKFKRISCAFKDIIYVSDKWFYLENPVTIEDNAPYFLYNSDFVYIECIGIHYNSTITKWMGHGAGLRAVPRVNLLDERKHTPNFMILCLDSISRNEFIRSMPKSLQVLKDEMGAVVFNGFNFVGGKSSENIFTLLTGLGLWEHQSVNQFYYGDNMDHTKLIFHVLKNDGYRTAFFKDILTGKNTFNFYKGFDKQPTDHYFNSANNLKSQENFHCFGNIPYYNLMLNLTKQFFQLDGKKFCLTYLCGHSMDSRIDNDIAIFLKWFKETRKILNTVIIVMSDHGLKYGSRNDQRLEETMPFLSIVLPQIIKKLRPSADSALKSNIDVLSTSHDVYDTILDIVELDSVRNNYVVSGSNIRRGFSLLNKIPKNRSCSDADLDPYWCCCTDWRIVSLTEPIYQRIVTKLVNHINEVSKRFPTMCIKRHLLHVEWVMRRAPKHSQYSYINHIDLINKIKEDNMFSGISYEYYQVKIVMGPKPAVYEAAVNYNVGKDVLTISDYDVTRLNTNDDEELENDGQDSPCINEYCLCKKH